MAEQSALSEKLIQELLSCTRGVMNHVYWFTHHLHLGPTANHYGASISYTDIKERKDDFLRELVATIASWVYGRAKAKGMFAERLEDMHGDISNASTFLTMQAFSKFRPGHPQGQFGELLLFNFIQHFFNAVPLLRKMRITTSTGHERFGADAIHVGLKGEGVAFLLGESKCYKSDYSFPQAFETSLSSILKTFDDLDNELELYVYEDFVDPELEKIAKDYKKGHLRKAHFQLVCLVAYNETRSLDGSNEDELRESIKAIICKRCQALRADVFSKIEGRILDRINYIVFPIWKLDDLLGKFSRLIGASNESD